MLNFLFGLIIFVINVAGWVVLAYTILSWIIPGNAYMQKAASFIEPILAPIRAALRRLLPQLFNTGLDFSPAVLWLLLQVARWLVTLLRNILL